MNLLQGILFYLPHLIFKSWEGGKVQGIVAGLNQVSKMAFDSSPNKSSGKRLI